MKKLDKWLLQELADQTFAHAFLETEANSRFAAQVQALRKQRGWTQEQLAAASRIELAHIEEIEKGRFGSLQLVTLRKLARAFDVHAILKFESVTDGAVDVVRYTEKDLELPTRIEELRALGMFSILPADTDNQSSSSK